MNADYYSILGIDKNATADDIKRAYRRLANIHHPDKGGNTEKFQEIEAAYRTLSDPQKRAEYDRPPQAQFPGGFNFNFGDFPFGDIFGQFHRPQQQQPAHLIYRTTISITLEQVFRGSQHNINLQSRSGNITAAINSPAGIEHGQQVKYDNIISGGSLIVTFLISPHLLYSRQGADIISEVNVNVLDLIVGTKIHVRGIDGREFEVNVPSRTQPGTILRIPGAGLPLLNTSSRGDHRIRVNAIIPASIPEAVIQAIKNTNNIKD